MWRAAAPDESHRRAIVADEGERQRRGGEIADSRDWDDVWRRLGAAGSKGGGQRRRQQRGGFGLISLFSILRITLVFFSLIFFGTFQVKPQERKELCGGREGQTTYYVERKALRCDPRKATLINLDRLAGQPICYARYCRNYPGPIMYIMSI